MSDLSDVSTSKQIVNDPASLCVQEVHNVLDRRTMSCNGIGHMVIRHILNLCIFILIFI